MKKYKFLVLTLLLAFLFFPKDVFAAEVDSNKVQIGTQELFWDGTNSQGGYESGRFNSTQNHIYQWGTSSATYKLFRFAPLVNFTSLGINTSYKARVAFYVFVDQPYSYDDKFCTLWSANGEKYSCSLYREMDDQIGSSSSLLTFVYDFEWTSSTGYVEFWLNFDNFYGIPDKTEFMYTILDFQGNVSGNQIILDGLGQTNEKLDKINDTLKDTFENCSNSPNLFTNWSLGGIDPFNGQEVSNDLRLRTSDFIRVNSSDVYFLSLSDWSYKFVNVFLYSSNNSNSFINGYYNIDPNINGSNNINVKFPPNVNYVRVLIGKDDDSVINLGDLSLAIPKMQRGKNGTICKNRIDETNEKLDELNQTLNDDDVSGATSTGNDFFDNFNSSDNGGISGIITAPLNAINAMLNGTCQPLSTTFKDKTISLQCGTDMWDKLSGIRDFLNLVLGGLLCYQICLKIFHIVQNLKNPDNDKVEVMNL